MALNIKNPEVEQLAEQAATLAHESKTEAIRVALQERVARLKMSRGRVPQDQKINALLSRFRKQFPKGDFGRKLSKAEEEKILGFGPGGF
jgi:antitoxin VapB